MIFVFNTTTETGGGETTLNWHEDVRSKAAERGTHMHKDFLFHHLSVCFPTQHQQYYFTIIGLRCSCQYFQYVVMSAADSEWQ